MLVWLLLAVASTAPRPPAPVLVPSPAVIAPEPGAGDGSASGVVRYRRPLRAPLVDRFRFDDGRYGPGNRGWEYATPPGTPVRAVAPGVVAFAGFVAGERYVSVLHSDGIRSTYSYLRSVEVTAGDRVAAGDVVGATGPRFQIGFRRGDVYLDPASLFGDGVARLVPDGRLPA